MSNTIVEERPMTIENWRLPDQDYRTKVLAAGDEIRVRSGLIYHVNTGVLRLQSAESDAILDYMNGCFEIPENISLKVFAQTNAQVSWCYWQDCNPLLIKLITTGLRQQHGWKIHHADCLYGKTPRSTHAFLLYLGKRFGTLSEDDYYQIPWAITHRQIADTINTTRVTVTRLMQTLKEQKIIRIDHHQRILVRA